MSKKAAYSAVGSLTPFTPTVEDRVMLLESSVNRLWAQERNTDHQLRHQIHYLIYGIGILCLLALYLWKE